MNPTPISQAIADALANFKAVKATMDPLAERQRENGAKEQRIAEELTTAEAIMAAADNEDRLYEERVAAAIAAAEKVPVISAPHRSTREKAEAVRSTWRALQSAKKKLEGDAIELSKEVAAVAANIEIARTHVIGAYFEAQTAKLRAMHDELEIEEGVSNALYRAMFAGDAKVSGTYAAAAERERVSWINTRHERIRAEAEKRAGELLARIPS